MSMETLVKKHWQVTSEMFNNLTDKTFKAHRDAEPHRDYVGASLIGGPCDREIGYTYTNTPKDTDGFPGRIYRIFDRGHHGEDRVANYLRIAGVDLLTHRPDGEQFEFSQLGGKFKGHADGVIMPSTFIGNPEPALWENKILNNASFGELYNNGVQKFEPRYYTQVQIYMAYLGLSSCVFTAENADTCEMFLELIPFDARHAQDMSDRAVRIVNAKNPEELPRCTRDSSDYRCKMCDFPKRCWKVK